MRRLALFAAAGAAGLSCITSSIQASPAAEDTQERAQVQTAPARAQLRAAETIEQVVSTPAAQRRLRANVRGVSQRDVARAAAQLDARNPARMAAIPDAEFGNVTRVNPQTLTALRALPPRRRGGQEIEQITPSRAAANVLRVRTRTSTIQADQGGGPPASFQAPETPSLDVNAFGEDLHAALSNSTNGYMMRIRQGGQTIYTLQWDWAQRPGDGARGWNPDRRMHIASVSKFITAVGLVHLLIAEGIDPDSEIVDYLPAYWAIGSNVEDISFTDLLRHESGFSTGVSDTGFVFMRQQVAAGVAGQGARDYENMNYGLMRILIATIGGYVDPNVVFGPTSINDSVWNAVSLAAYVDYMETHVFGPAGVSNPTLGKQAGTARAYTINGGGSWNTGNLSDWAGGAAWHMSVDEVLDVASLFRRGNAGITRSQASNALARNFGVDGRVNTGAGPIYHKNGIFRNIGACPGRSEEQAVLLFLPEDMELALFVNSPVGSSCTFLRTLVTTLYTDNLVDP